MIVIVHDIIYLAVKYYCSFLKLRVSNLKYKGFYNSMKVAKRTKKMNIARTFPYLFPRRVSFIIFFVLQYVPWTIRKVNK